MSDTGKISFSQFSELVKLREATNQRLNKREKGLLFVISLSFLLIWTYDLSFPHNQWFLFSYLCPAFLTFNARRRLTIIGVGAASMLAGLVDIFFIHPQSYPTRLGADTAFAFAVTIQSAVFYFSIRQQRILMIEQKKRIDKDARLREMESELSALGRRQRALQRLTSLMAENAPVAIAQLTPELNYAMVNPIYLNLLRVETGDPALELVGKKLTEHLWSDEAQAQETLSMINHGLPVKMSAQASEARLTGKVTYWDWTLWPVRDEAGSTEGVLLLGAEVTERIQAEQKLESARFELEKSNHAKDLFLATLSHELRTPLTPILGWAKIMQDFTSDQAMTTQGLQAIERNARLQAQLVDDLLDLSRITMGKIELAKEPVDLNEIVRRALETVQYRIDSQQLHLWLDLPKEALLAQGDAVRLEQVVWNLLTNAVKFTAADGQVNVRVYSEGEHCVIEVSDNGIGIEADILPFLFEPFKQADSSITRRHGGLGIGLALVSSLVKLHGGTVTAHSAGAGQGSRFVVSLPCYEVTEGEPMKNSKHPGVQRLDGLKVLVIEDVTDTRELLGILLRSYGCVVESAASVQEAWKLVFQSKPDVIVSDIGLPETDGYEFADQLKRMPEFAQIPMLALTGYAKEADRTKAYDSGFDWHLPKPVDPEILVQAIAQLVRPSTSTSASEPTDPATPA